MAKRYLSNDEQYLFAEGSWQQAYTRFGAHRAAERGKDGYAFAVWAPGAKSVRVTGDFCDWDPDRYVMLPTDTAGVWHLLVSGARAGDAYKYVVETPEGELLYKADPYAFWAQQPPETASRLWDLEDYRWSDARWLAKRKRQDHMTRPLNIYEVHLGSWRRNEDGSYYSYDQLAETLIPYAVEPPSR